MSKGQPAAARRLPLLAAGALLLAYAVALLFRRDSVPAGLCNDAAEEALRGVILLAQHRLEPITTVLGNSAETLYLYLLGISSRVLGPTTLAIQIVSWLFAIGTVVLTAAVVQRIDARVPPVIPIAIAATSVWLFHYARSGLRAITAPFFVLLFVFFALRAEERRRDAVLAGVALALGVYGYTAFRVVPIAWAVWAGWRAARGRGTRAAILTAAAALIVSIPNFVFFARAPREFLLRGAYVMRGGVLGNTVATALMPFVHFDEYRDLKGPHHFFDGVSAGLTRAQINPVHLLIAILFAGGVVVALRRRLDTGLLLLIGATAVVIVGAAGPSLTRMLVALPVVLVMASIGAAQLPRIAFAATIAFVAATHGYAYFVRFPADSTAQYYFSPAATPIGKRAAELRRSGARVLCIITKDANVIRYLTAGGAAIAEFYNRPFDARELPEVNPDVVLIERDPRFAGVEHLFPHARVEILPSPGAPRR